MRRIIFVIILSLTASILHAQEQKDWMKEYNNMRKAAMAKYESYREEANSQYAEHMRRAWEEYSISKGELLPQRKKPVTPVVKSPETPSVAIPTPVAAIVEESQQTSEEEISETKDITKSIEQSSIIASTATTIAQPTDKEAIKEQSSHACEHSKAKHSFEFYGSRYSVSLSDEERFELSGVNNHAIADAWEQIAANQGYYALCDEILGHRDLLRLCDWGYIKYTERLTESFFGKEHTDEARLAQIFLLAQSGYSVRIAIVGGHIAMMLPSNETIYEYPYITIDNKQYYLFDKASQSERVSIYDREFEGERNISLHMDQLPILSTKYDLFKSVTQGGEESITVSMKVNRNLIEFFNDYPHTGDFKIYVDAPIDEMTQHNTIEPLRKIIAGKSDSEAANELLRFIHQHFAYKTDSEQFGYERPLFFDETLYYPYCDCEDRAILYAKLIRELLGLDVILLHYPNHIATAVHFGEDIAGEYVTYRGERYYVCDPTYINASIGEQMPGLGGRIEIIGLR